MTKSPISERQQSVDPVENTHRLRATVAKIAAISLPRNTSVQEFVDRIKLVSNYVGCNELPGDMPSPQVHHQND